MVNMKYIILIIYALISNSALLVMKYGANKAAIFNIAGGILNLKISLYSLLGFCLYILSFLIYIYLISKYNLTYLVPITSAISYILIFVFSLLFLNETLSVTQYFGFFVILIGVILMNIK